MVMTVPPRVARASGVADSFAPQGRALMGTTNPTPPEDSSDRAARVRCGLNRAEREAYIEDGEGR